MATGIRHRRWIGIAASAASLFPVPALACTLCHTPEAESVRDRLLAPDLWWNACAVALPLALLLSVVAMVVREPADRLRS